MSEMAWVRCSICHDDARVPVASIELYRRPDGRHHYVANCPRCGPFVHAVGPKNIAHLAERGVTAKAIA